MQKYFRCLWLKAEAWVKAEAKNKAETRERRLQPLLV